MVGGSRDADTSVALMLSRWCRGVAMDPSVAYMMGLRYPEDMQVGGLWDARLVPDTYCTLFGELNRYVFLGLTEV